MRADSAADDRGEEDDAPRDGRGDEVARARLGEEHRSPGVHPKGAVPLRRRQLEERRRFEGAGGADKHVEAALTLEHVGDEPLRTRDLREIRRMRRGSKSEPLDCRLELGVREIDAGDVSAGGDERLGAGVADPALRPGDERDSAFEATHASATIASTSTGMSNGRCGTPTDVRAARRSSP